MCLVNFGKQARFTIWGAHMNYTYVVAGLNSYWSDNKRPILHLYGYSALLVIFLLNRMRQAFVPIFELLSSKVKMAHCLEEFIWERLHDRGLLT